MQIKPIQLEQRQKRDFGKLQKFPGDIGNPFDLLLRRLNKINSISPLIFFVLLIGLSIFGTFFNVRNALILLIFFILDWTLIFFLKYYKISFGEPQSQVILLAILRTPFIWLPNPLNIIFQTIGTLFVFYGFYLEPSIIKISKQALLTDKFTDKNRIKLIQLGDLHLERYGVREKKLKEILSGLKPDIIVYTGDFLNLSYNSDTKSMSQVTDFFNDLEKIAKTYYVSGSPAVDLKDTLTYIENNTSAKRLDNEQIKVKIGNQIINIIGLTCSHNPTKDSRILKTIEITPEHFNLFLYHSPDLIFEITEKKSVDLMLSGHTHGGQVRLPFIGAIFTGSLYGRLIQTGLYKYMNTLLYISRGIGFEGMGAPRVRFLCKPEIVEWMIDKN